MHCRNRAVLVFPDVQAGTPPPPDPVFFTLDGSGQKPKSRELDQNPNHLRGNDTLAFAQGTQWAAGQARRSSCGTGSTGAGPPDQSAASLQLSHLQRRDSRGHRESLCREPWQSGASWSGHRALLCLDAASLAPQAAPH